MPDNSVCHKGGLVPCVAYGAGSDPDHLEEQERAERLPFLVTYDPGGLLGRTRLSGIHSKVQDEFDLVAGGDCAEWHLAEAMRRTCGDANRRGGWPWHTPVILHTSLCDHRYADVAVHRDAAEAVHLCYERVLSNQRRELLSGLAMYSEHLRH